MADSPPVNITTRLRDTAARVPERPALVMPDGELLCFGSLWDRVCRVSTGLQAAGLRPGDRMVVMIPMSLDLYTILLAIIKTGAVAVFVDPWMPMRRIAQFAAFAAPAGFAGVGRSHLLRLLAPGLRALPVTVTTGRRAGPFPARRTLAELCRSAPDPHIWQPDSADAPALITFTSGSSGIPKGANRTHGFLAAQHAALCQEYRYEASDIDMPMFPVFALRNLADGIPSVIPDMDFRHVAAVNGTTILRQIKRHGVTTCTASPPFVDRLAGAISASGPAPTLRRILTGGAPVPDAMLRLWQAILPGTAVTVVYGSTEAEPVASMSLHERLAVSGEGTCAGVPVDSVQARIIRIARGPVTFTSWEALAPDATRIGELVVAGPHICRDYFRNPEAVAGNKITDAEGVIWHRMGDTGYLDDAGRFWLTGRVHSTILCKGEPLHAQLIEAQVARLTPGATRIAALEHDERLVIVVQGPAIPGLRQRLRADGIPADTVIFTRKPLPLDPRHQSKLDYSALRHHLTTIQRKRRAYETET